MSGIGMQGLARIAKECGHGVSGYDDFHEIQALKDIGIIYKNTIDNDVDMVVYSSAIRKNHPLMIEAEKRGILCINRTDFLIKSLSLNNEKILVAGAHGKTTVTSLIAHLLGKKSYIIGGIFCEQKYAGHHEPDKYTVIETDESDGSFIKWSGKYKILLNFDYEHMGFYKTEALIKEYYCKFITQDLDDTIVICDKQAKDFLNIPEHKNIITFGNAKADYTYSDIKFLENGLDFDVNGARIFVPLLGMHNAHNATAVYALCKLLGKKFDLNHFPGVKKRMQFITTSNGHKIYSDYGHHISEIEATLNGILMHKHHKPHVVIEPARYTRLKDTWDMWPKVLAGYKVFIVPLYSCGEDEIEGINEVTLVEFLQKSGVDVTLLKSIEDYVCKNETVCFSLGKLSRILDQEPCTVFAT
jgi:UDP-N-acetylmuramate--alanine ligase